ncbi:MAG: hypothetical protein U1F60_01560 [Planctomycetota bacterium]
MGRRVRVEPLVRGDEEIADAPLVEPATMVRNHRSCPSLLALCSCLVAGCTTSNSHFGIVLQPKTTATLRVQGDNPFVQVDNDGPGAIDVSFAPGVGMPDRVRVLRGSSARSLRNGGVLQFELVEGEQADLQVHVQNGTGTDLEVATKGR